jgi:hypothetical protein
VRAILCENEAAITTGLLEDTAGKAEKEIDGCGLNPPGQARDEAIVQFFRTLVIGKAVSAVVDTFLRNYDDIMAGKYHGELLITDYLCGMTDSFAANLHRELFNG